MCPMISKVVQRSLLFIIKLNLFSSSKDLLAFTNTENLTIQDEVPTAEDLTLPAQDSLHSLENDCNRDFETSDQEFVYTQDSMGLRHKIQVLRQRTASSPTRPNSGPDSVSLRLYFHTRHLG